MTGERMTGRSLCMDQQEQSKRNDDDRIPQNEHSRFVSPNCSNDIPMQHVVSFPQLVQADSTSQIRHPHKSSPVSQFVAERSRTDRTLQEATRCSSINNNEVRSTAASPALKLPPINPKLPDSSNMPPHSSPQLMPTGFPQNECKTTKPTLVDMKIAYQNMMLGYFMPQEDMNTKSESSSTLEKYASEQILAQQLQRFNQLQFSPALSCNSYSPMSQFSPGSCAQNGSECQDSALPYTSAGNFHGLQTRSVHFPGGKYANYPSECVPQASIALNESVSSPISTQNSGMCSTQSGCGVLDSRIFSDTQRQGIASFNAQQADNTLHQQSECTKCSNVNESGLVQNQIHIPNAEGSILSASDERVNISEMSAVLNDLSMFMPVQSTGMIGTHAFSESNNRTSISGSSLSTQTTALSTNSAANHNIQYQAKQEPNWCHFSVLPPVMSSASPMSGTTPVDGDNISMLSYNSISTNAQNSPQMGMYYSPFSPFSMNLSDNLSSAFAASPRYSGRSSYSGKCSRNKRALSNSPLSAEGIDLNSIIRMSPTSLIAYINGSRSSSSCISPGSAGEKTGCYGHLSARNSSSSPPSGSGSSGTRRSISQTATPGTSNSCSNQSSNLNDHSNMSNPCSSNIAKADYLGIEQNLLVIQAMQDLEAGTRVASMPLSNNTLPNSLVMPDCENLQILPQDIAAFNTQSYIPYVPTVLPPVHTHLQSQFDMQNGSSTHNKPPPTYDQHMARKATLQKKNSSSDSSQPSNSSSFESSEGDKTAVGGSSTDTESGRMYACRWLDCASVFHDQDEFVTHIEKVHIDQKKGDDFVCFWKLCPRRLHPFNARYKLLVHMRTHSGDKPNKCTFSGCKKAFSRLENLKIHVRSHTGERPYSCTFEGCNKTFSNSSDRAKHQRTHQDTRPYVCQVPGCGKRYTDPSSLRKHVKSSHADKKEPGRKKIKGVGEELDPKHLSECLVIQAIRPITHNEASPPERTDSGLGRSPRGSQPGSSSDHYPGMSFSCETINRSGTTQGNASQASPSSQHSSPPGQNDREKLPTNSSLKVPILPPISSSVSQTTNRGKSIAHQNFSPRSRPMNSNLRAGFSMNPTSAAHPARSFSGHTPLSASVFEATPPTGGGSTLYPYTVSTRCQSNLYSPSGSQMSPESIFDSLSKFEGVS